MRIRFGQKLFALFFGSGVILAAALISLVYIELRDLPKDLTRALLAVAVSQSVDAFDPADIAAVPDGPDSQNSPAFKRLHATLLDINNAATLFGPKATQERFRNVQKDIYIVVKTPNPNIGKLLVTIRPSESGRLYDMSRFPQMMAGWKGVAADAEISSDEFGQSMSAYAPIRDRSGNVVALLGIDAPAQFIIDTRRVILNQAAAALAVAIVVSALFAILFARRLNRPIRVLDEAMTRVAEGDLDARAKIIRTGDEFDRLIRRFNRMIVGLRDRQNLKESLELARQVQQELLPAAPPAATAFDIFGAAVYCDETGGDFYDFIPISPDLLAVAVGDVTGHGIGPALLMASARAVLRSHAPACATDLPTLLARVNAHLANDTRQGRFITLFYALLHAPTRSLHWISAGHEPALLYRAATQSIETLNATGIPLGIFPESTYHACPLQLHPGDILLIGTDGLRETRNPANEMFGPAGLAQLLQQSASLPAQQIHHALLQSLSSFRQSSRPHDDIALVVIKSLPLATGN